MVGDEFSASGLIPLAGITLVMWFDKFHTLGPSVLLVHQQTRSEPVLSTSCCRKKNGQESSLEGCSNASYFPTAC